MLYAIGKNKIVRADNDGISVAEIHFHETAPHVYEITEVLTAAPDDDDQDLDKLMSKMVSHMRKHGNTIYSRDDFAQEWLEDHPESHDIWRDAPSKHTSVSEAVSQIAESFPESRASREDGSNEDLSDGRLPEKGLTAAELPSKGVRKFGRFLQYLSVLAMLGIVALFVLSAVQNISTVSETLKDSPTGLNVFRLATLITPIIGILLALWILSRRRFTIDGVKTRLDCGRGAFPFTILLIALILTPTASLYLANLMQAGTHAGLAMGLRSFLTVFSIRAVPEGGLAAAGLLLSIIRQFVGR